MDNDLKEVGYEPPENDYKSFKSQGTGGHSISQEYKTIVFPFDKYEITVKLTLNNEFVNIEGVKINKDFTSYKQKITSNGFHDVEKFYKE
ncbi:MAG: hypothetical protein ABSF36_08315 [Candidatus Methanomethylicaceae archaeon]|jgi:hypothetical protein